MCTSHRPVIALAVGIVAILVVGNVLAWGPVLWVALFAIGVLIGVGMSPRIGRRA